ncbi:PAS domain-containing sensor histidine kinase [Cellvibrio sp. PSBB023]|uniref:sensor histidine kinase n=1 Tax=Cellvibrio sp. PSBB023 TaxID=1945512 RepID=UPI00098EA0D2|nr:ATP-binding protein [Cellvibrio sp. PSBB023]AQT59349.1 PAS domain-containing sensor histidine kinase [Cellvibrio sp. PSBB023]
MTQALLNTVDKAGLTLVPVGDAANTNAGVLLTRPLVQEPLLVKDRVLAEKSQDLKSAFALFDQLSNQLADSYHLLENRVAELNEELSSLSDRRLQELAEKEKLAHRLESLLNFLPGGVVVLDSSGRVSECNPAALDLLGEPLQGELWREVIKRSFAPRQDDGHEVSLHDGRRISIQTRNLGEDGQIILLTDQTETRRLQGELSRHERLSALGKMMGALAHQIRTPLSSAMLYAGHLCDGKLDDMRRQQFSEKILGRLNNIERQIQDMLFYVKGELQLNDVISVAQLQNELAEAMEVPLMTSESSCEWVMNCREEYIQCNRDALVGAVLNLVNNAIQAVERKAHLRIEFNTYPNALKSATDKHRLPLEQEAPRLWIRVCDKGPGMAPELLNAVGDLFVTTKAQGTGLGLSVVQAVARAHHGKFLLQSTVGKGTCASLLIPFATFQSQGN